jgi:hypothetical protein
MWLSDAVNFDVHLALENLIVEMSEISVMSFYRLMR